MVAEIMLSCFLRPVGKGGGGRQGEEQMVHSCPRAGIRSPGFLEKIGTPNPRIQLAMAIRKVRVLSELALLVTLSGHQRSAAGLVLILGPDG